ncbi:UNVERIFIED_CONTAM: hypothetical protein Scaly_1627500 [Sesamum calycinum]|uniref:Transposase MuDR plant domain-containing protein n=1 Tax=Sesamum calycinum TaxID=2727403 RepID=A0AAW2PBT3_9LAMI
MFVRLEDEVEVNIYIHGEVRENEEQGRGDESNTSGENFEDTDSEYEYKISEETEEQNIENEEDDEGTEVSQKQQNENTVLEEDRVDDTDIEWYGDENIVCSGDELPSDKESDGEGKNDTFPIFNPSCLFEPTFGLGMIFSNKKELREAIQSHAIKNKRNIKIAKNDKERLHAKCADNDCMWRIHACALKSECTFQIRDSVPNHTCNITFHVKNMKSTWLSKKYMHKFKTDPKRGIKGFRVDAIEEIRCNITKNQAARAKRLALLMLEGSATEQYALLWDYADEIKRSNPGSTVILGTEQEGGQNMFDKFYGAYGEFCYLLFLLTRTTVSFPFVMLWKWDLSGIPCKHAISAIFCQGENIENYTYQCYRVEKYLKVYEHAILPINGRKEWKKSDFVPPVPPNLVKKVGRPRKTRRTCQGPVIDVVTDAASQVMGRNEAVAEAPNEAVAESETIPQKLKGYIPPTSAFKLPPKATATAPTMFEQFKQCQNGVKIREPASFIDGERQNQEVSNSGSTPSIVKGRKRFITLSNLSEAVNEGKQKKDKGKKKM